MPIKSGFKIHDVNLNVVVCIIIGSLNSVKNYMWFGLITGTEDRSCACDSSIPQLFHEVQ